MVWTLSPRPAPLLALALAGCGGGPFTVVTIEARPAVADVRTVELSLSNANARSEEHTSELQSPC